MLTHSIPLLTRARAIRLFQVKIVSPSTRPDSAVAVAGLSQSVWHDADDFLAHFLLILLLDAQNLLYKCFVSLGFFCQICDILCSHVLRRNTCFSAGSLNHGLSEMLNISYLMLNQARICR